MTAKKLRRLYIEFFTRYGHQEFKSAPLIPENDPTVLFTTAGMHPLVPFLMGEKHPAGNRLVNYQKCIRTGDIDEVGDPAHLTFFEMLGNWSLGDYFKEEAIRFSYEFLTGDDWLNLPVEQLAFSVFAGDDDAPFDEESFNVWMSLGIAEARIARLDKSHNWWGPAGQTGPCGPDTEMFYWAGDGPAPETFDPEDSNWLEIWNDVFMEFNKTEDGTYEALAQKNVDTGMGLERVTAVLQGKSSCYETELFTPIFDRLREISSAEDPSSTRAGRIVADHLRAATFILADGVVPSNGDQGYILRRLIRRAVREGRQIGITGPFIVSIADVVIENYRDVFPELDTHADAIRDELAREETLFGQALEKGLKEFNKQIDAIPDHVQKKRLSGRQAFYLYETFGFPLEVIRDLTTERGVELDEKGFQVAYEKHQAKSRAGAEQKFKGGLADHSVNTTQLHTATHLLQAALKQVLGEHVQQKGSNITEKRLRFDFSHSEKMSKEQIQAVEELANTAITDKLSVTIEEMDLEAAKESGATGYFEDRYGDRVKVYTIGGFSMEICGGPHVTNTAELGLFKIVKEESVSRGVRRIKATLG